MKRILIKNVKQGEKVFLKGFVHAIRVQSSVIFIELRDISGIIQLVVEKKPEEVFSIAKSLVLETIIQAEGIVKEQHGKVEVLVKSISVISVPAEKMPIAVNEKAGEETELNARLVNKHIELRKPKNQLMYKIWTQLTRSYTTFLLERGFIQIHSPKLMGAPSESGAEVFEVNYLGGKAYLAQSPQFYKQMALVSGFEKVFEIAPVFRAENSNTTRHATEFMSYDLEFAYIETYEELMAFEEELLQFIFTNIKETFGNEISEVYGLDVVIPEAPFPRIPLLAAKEILAQRGIESEKENDISPIEERALGEYVMGTYGHEFVFVTEYPIQKRPFYHMRPETNQNITNSFDLLYKGIEITTGAQREHRYEILKKQAIEKEMNLKNIEFYLNFFKHACPPHGGFAIGPERILMKMLGFSNIREVQFVYRGPNRLLP